MANPTLTVIPGGKQTEPTTSISASVTLSTALRVLLWITTCALLILCMHIPRAHAQKQQIKIQHFQLKRKELPPAGKQFNLAVKLLRTRRIDLPMKLIISRDGYVEELIAKEPVRNEKDQPTYQFPVFSPRAELRYRFVLLGEEKNIESEEYAVRRPCLDELPKDYEYADLSELEPEERLEQLAVTAAYLERDVNQYESAIQLVKELQQRLER